jgi:CSLREA domain-containing protein
MAAPHRHAFRYSAKRLAARVGLMIALLAGLLANLHHVALHASADTPELQILAPQHVEVGQVIEITLALTNQMDIAAFETNVLFDRASAELAGLHHRPNSLQQLGRDTDLLVATDLPTGSAIGLYSCLARCADDEMPAEPGDVRDAPRLATIDIIVHRPGSFEIRFDAMKFVDSAGERVTVANPTSTLIVAVGSGDSYYPAPQAPWSLSSMAPIPSRPFDLTDDGRVGYADIMEATLAWQWARQRAAVCGEQADLSRDVDHDGCIDVADIQKLVAASEATSAQQEPHQLTTTNSTLVVNTNGDAADARIGDGICATAEQTCSLRAAIQEANRRQGSDTINFSISGSGTQTIHLTKPLPTLNDLTGGTTIDGYTQPGASPNTDPYISDATIQIQLAGPAAGSFNGLVIVSPNNMIRGLALFKLAGAIWIKGRAANDNVIVGNYIGTDAAGNEGAPELSPLPAHGVLVEQGASRNVIGGAAPSERNVISGNARNGIGFWHQGTDGNLVINNLIGLGPRGDKRLSNRRHGIDINLGASHTVIGGTQPGERNVVSGNDLNGIEVSHTASTTQNLIIGNLVGTDASGLLAYEYSSNLGTGISVKDRVVDNLVSDNVVGNNKQGGITIDNYGTCCTDGNQFVGNRVGISLDGSAIPNARYGFGVFATGSRIGPNNTIANNPVGIQIEGNASDRNTVTQNIIYNSSVLGIDLSPVATVNENDVDDADDGPNQQLNFPVLTQATPQSVRGQACGDCLIEVFLATGSAENHGEAQSFVGAAAATSDGLFEVPVSGVEVGDFITATATNAEGNTSEFALNLAVLASTGTPPTIDAGGPYTVNEGDSLALTASADDPLHQAIGYAWDLDGNGSFETPSNPVPFPATQDGPASSVIAVEARTADGRVATDQTTVDVLNVAPVALFRATKTVQVLTPIELQFTNPSDSSPADTAAGFGYAFDCGDGAGYGSFTSTPRAQCTTLEVGLRFIGGKIRDKDGGETAYTTSVDVVARIALPGHFEAEDYRAGKEGSGYHDTTAGNSGGAYRADDVDIAVCANKTSCNYVGWIAKNEWLAYDINVAATASYTFTARMSSSKAPGRFHIEVDGVDVSGSVLVPATNGRWTEVMVGPINLTAGDHTLKLVADSHGMSWDYVKAVSSMLLKS